MLFLFSCTDETKNSFDKQLLNPLLAFNFTVETSTFTKSKSTTDNPLDVVAQYPHFEKSRVNFELYQDGKYLIKSIPLEPEQNFEPIFEGPPNPDPEVVKSILEYGKITLHFKDGTTQYAEVTPTDFSHLIFEIESWKEGNSPELINRAIASMQFGGFDNSLNDLLNNPSKYGATIINNKGISSKNNETLLNIAMSEQDEDGNYTGNNVVLLVDTENNRLLGKRIYDSGGNILDALLVAYNGENDGLSSLYHITNTTLPSGADATEEIINKISDLNIEI